MLPRFLALVHAVVLVAAGVYIGRATIEPARLEAPGSQVSAPLDHLNRYWTVAYNLPHRKAWQDADVPYLLAHLRSPWPYSIDAAVALEKYDFDLLIIWCASQQQYSLFETRNYDIEKDVVCQNVTCWRKGLLRFDQEERQCTNEEPASDGRVD